MRFLIIFIIIAGCAMKDYDLNPWTTVVNQIIKTQHGN
tara:strand:- start:765 stop:878 length:114 start_codon:yes stop_codon:yes gene_type:complete